MSDMLNGKTALVTGCAGGLGLDIASTLAANGARIIAMDIDGDTCDRATGALRTAGYSDVEAVEVDVASAKSVARAFATVEAITPRIDIVVNNAGVREINSILDLDPAEWDRVISINLSGPFYVAREAALRMRTTGGGSIVNMSSTAGMLGMPNRPAYNASKHGLIGLTRNLAMDLAPFDIRVNAVAPGLVRSPLTEPYFTDPSFAESLQQMVPMGAGASPRDVSQAVLYLCSSMAAFVTGIVLPVDGGWTAAKTYAVGAAAAQYNQPAAST